MTVKFSPIFRLLFVFACSCLVGVSAATADVNDFARTTNPLTTSQQQQLQSFIDTGLRGLQSAEPKAVVRARKKLVAPLVRVGTSAVFREAYGDIFMQSGRALLTDTGFQAANAAQVLAFVRTGASNEKLASLLTNPASTAPGAEATRIAASSMLVLSLRTTSPELIRPRQYNAIVRSIDTGSATENNWVVLQHEVEALAAIGSNSNVPDDIQKSAIEGEMKVLTATLDRIAKGDSLAIARSVSPIILTLRHQYLNLSGPMRRTFAAATLPSLLRVVDAGNRAWEPLQKQSGLAEAYGDAISQAAVLARLVLGPDSTAAPSGDPADAWRSGDQSGYGRAARSWMQLAQG